MKELGTRWRWESGGLIGPWCDTKQEALEAFIREYPDAAIGAGWPRAEIETAAVDEARWAMQERNG